MEERRKVAELELARYSVDISGIGVFLKLCFVTDFTYWRHNFLIFYLFLVFWPGMAFKKCGNLCAGVNTEEAFSC